VWLVIKNKSITMHGNMNVKGNMVSKTDIDRSESNRASSRLL